MSGGDNGASACKSGEAMTSLSSAAVLGCSPVQSRVTGTCPSGRAISAIDQDGIVDCQPSVTQMMGGSIGAVCTSGSCYLAAQGLSTEDASFGPVTVGSSAVSATAENLYVNVATAPGTGNSYSFSLIGGSPFGGSLHCTITGSATSCSDTGEVKTITAGSTYALEIDVAGTPSATRVTFGWTDST